MAWWVPFFFPERSIPLALVAFTTAQVVCLLRASSGPSFHYAEAIKRTRAMLDCLTRSLYPRRTTPATHQVLPRTRQIGAAPGIAANSRNQSSALTDLEKYLGVV
ncbi:MAG TPA: hypothetical protein VFV38_30595 [Ktedonobacteraceae bacterium]|nr:hypothetical protein [Ktedonobacteraceae bacterium]